jgi:hypothetical protein
VKIDPILTTFGCLEREGSHIIIIHFGKKSLWRLFFACGA